MFAIAIACFRGFPAFSSERILDDITFRDRPIFNIEQSHIVL